MSRTITRRRGGVLMAILLGLTAHASCSSDDTKGSSAQGGGGTSNGEAGALKPIGGSVKSPIGAAGGSISSADGRLKLEIPAGALSETREIELQQLDVPGGWGWSMRPDGTTFAVPVNVTLSLNSDEVAPAARGTEGSNLTVQIESLATFHGSRPPKASDGPIELLGTWNADASKLVFAGQLDHFSDLVAVSTGYARWVYPSAGKVGEKLTLGASRLVDAEFTEREIVLHCPDDPESRFRLAKIPVKTKLTGFTASSGGGAVTVAAEATPLDIPGVSGFELEATSVQTGKVSVRASASLDFEREGGLPWPSGCAPGRNVVSHLFVIDCTAPGGIAGRYIHKAAPGNCDDDTSTTAWYVHENGAITNDFSAGCTNAAGKPYVTPFAMWEMKDGTLKANDCTKQVDAQIGALRSLTFNTAKNRWEGTEDRSGSISQVCLTGPEPWDFKGKCVATGCQVVDVTCDAQPKKLLNNCEACPSNCEGCGGPRPWPWEGTVVPVCY